MYAIVETSGEQIKVAPGDSVRVPKMCGDVASEIVMDKVLVLGKEDGTVFGKPYVEGASVKAEITGAVKDKKILVLRHRAKKAHNKLTGHRQQYTTIKIKEIIGG